MGIVVAGALIWAVFGHIKIPAITPDLLFCRHKYDLSDAATVPLNLERAFRQFPWALMNEASNTCSTYKTSTLCKVSFTAPPDSWRFAYAGCDVMFYGGITDSVFESINCSVAGPSDGSITVQEQNGVIALNNAMLTVAIDLTMPNLPTENRIQIRKRIIEQRSVSQAQWTYTMGAPIIANLTGFTASRGFETVTAEYHRRFCEP